MQIFKDNAGRDWTISLTIGTAMAVKDRHGIDLLQPELGDPPLLTRLGTDEMLLAQVIASLLESQFEHHKVDAAEIYNSFDGDTFARAHEAFYREMIDFFRKRGREDRAKAVEKQKAMLEAAIQAARTRIDGLDVETVIEQTLGKISGE